MRVLVVSADRTAVSGYPCNIGDSLLTDALLEFISVQGHAADAVDFGAERSLTNDTERPRTRVDSFLQFISLIGKADLVLIGGGTMLQDDVGEGVRGLPRLVAVTSFVCRILRVRCVFFGVGSNPVRRRTARLLLMIGVRGRVVYARSAQAAERARKFGAAYVAVSGDAVHLLESSRDLENSIVPRRGLAIALAFGDGHMLTEAILRRLIREFERVEFLRMDQRLKFGDGEDLSGEVKEDLVLFGGNRSAHEFLGVISGCVGIVSSRLHALYIAGLQGVPMCGIRGRRKVEEFAEAFDVPLVDDIEQFVLSGFPLGNPNEEFSRVRVDTQACLSTVLSEQTLHPKQPY